MIEAPSVMADGDSVAPGVQADVQLRTTLAPGDVVDLEVASATGATLAMLSAPVDADGNAMFAGISMLPPSVTLRASGQGLCGIGRDERAVDVMASLGNASCAVTMTPAPEANPYYLQRGFAGVLSAQSDPDPAAPGYQTTLHVATLPGWSAELFQAGPQAPDAPPLAPGAVSLGTLHVDAGGAAAMPVTVADGAIGFYAVCHGPAGSGGPADPLPSAMTTVVVDTTPPTCAMVTPDPASTITPQLDGNANLRDGIQLALVAHATGDDVAGEAASLAVGPVGQSLVALAPSAVSADGTTTAPATLAPPSGSGTYAVELAMHDHAGNPCTSSAHYDVEYKGCDIKVLAPAAVVAGDADGNPANGSQVDLKLDVSPACRYQLVTATCGASAPAGFADASGRVALRPTVCTTSPCQTAARCIVSVTRVSFPRAVPPVESQLATTILFDDLP